MNGEIKVNAFDQLAGQRKVDAIVAALAAHDIKTVAVDAPYNLVWVRANGVVAGIITGYEGCGVDTFAIIDRFGYCYGYDDYGYSIDGAVAAVASYIRDGRTRKTRKSANVLVADGQAEELDWDTLDLSGGIDDLLEGAAEGLRDDAFRGDFDHMEWQDAEVYVLICPEIHDLELARVPVFEDAEGSESFEAKRMDALEADLKAKVVLSARSLRSEAGLDDDEGIEGIVDAVEKAVGTWANGENSLGVNIFNCNVGIAEEGSGSGEFLIEVSCHRDVFRDDVIELQDELDEVVAQAIEGFVPTRG